MTPAHSPLESPVAAVPPDRWASSSTPHVSADPLHAQPLHPAFLPRLRSDGAIQLGADPVHGRTLQGPAGHEVIPVLRVLQILAGATDPVPIEALVRASGLPDSRVHEVVTVLQRAGLTDPAPHGLPWPGDRLGAWPLARQPTGGEHHLLPGPLTALAERRAGARVVVDGRGPLVGAIGQLLRQAEVGSVRIGWHAEASEDLDDEDPDPAVVVLVGPRLPLQQAAVWRRRGTPVLPVVTRPGSVDIGPLLVIGRGPCIHCIRLGEGESPLTDVLTDDGTAVTVVEPTLAGIAAGVIAMLVLGVIDAYPPPLGIRWHTALPLPSLATSAWALDPECTWTDHHSTTQRRAGRPPARACSAPGETMTR